MPEPTQSKLPPAPARPLHEIPVTAEDVARRKRRIVLAWCAAAAALGVGAFWAYKRSTDPSKARQSYDAGVRLANVARYTEAILSLDRAIDIEPGFADAYLERGRIHVAAYDADQAIQDFSSVLRLRPRNAEAFLLRGQEYLLEKNDAAAAADATSAIGIDSRLAAAYNLRGAALRASGNPSAAIPDFTRALELAPDADNYYQRGATYQILGQHKLAIADFTQMIAFDPAVPQGYYARAESERALGDPAAAEADQSMAKKLDGQ